MKTENKELQKQTLDRIRKDLEIRRKHILALPAEKALEAILDAPDALPLVHSFSEEDLFFLIHEAGLEDALPLVELASDNQWEYMIDREIWTEDRISSEALTRWMSYLLEAAPQRLIHWVTGEKVELLEFYLMKNIEVALRVHDQDPSELGDDFFTHDDVYYVRIRDYPFEPPLEKEARDQRDALATGILDRIAEADFITYQKILLETQTVLPAEMEEEFYRQRNVRLAEKGFVPPEEAVGVYQPLPAYELKEEGKKKLAGEAEYEPAAPVPILHAGVMKQEHVFSRALSLIDSEAALQQLQAEFAGLCNRIIAADRRPVREREELKEVVAKACGYVQIGMEEMTGIDGSELTPSAAAGLIRTWPVENIFRIGSGKVLEIKWRVEKWFSNNWMKANRLSIRFWDEQGTGYLGGLLLKRPMFFDNYRTGVIYRDFQSMADVRETANAIDEIIAYDGLLGDLNIPVKPVDERFFTFKNFLLTLWARNSMGLSAEMGAIPFEKFKEFLENLFEPDNAGRIGPEARHSFLAWLARRAGRDEADISQKLGHALETLFDQIEQELGRVPVKKIDPKFVQLFFVERQPVSNSEK